MDYKNHLETTRKDNPGNQTAACTKRRDGLYIRVSISRPTHENEFDDLLGVSERDGSGRDWNQIRK